MRKFLPLVLLVVVGVSGVSGEEKAAWTWKTEAGKTLELQGAEGVVWRLNYGKDLSKVYFDPVRTADGVDVSWAAPYDHPWHYGLWYSWKSINGVNYWETDKNNNGHPRGRTMVENVEVLEQTQAGTKVKIEFTLRPDSNAEPVGRETVLLTIETPRTDGSYAIDWHRSTRALVDLEFGRTSGYGGMAFRTGECWTEPRFQGADGPIDLGGPIKVYEGSPWVTLSGLCGEKPVGLTFFDHPDNPRHPTPWFLLARLFAPGQSKRFNGAEEGWPFYYSNPALIGKAPYKLAKGKTLTLSYRVLIHPGRGEVKQMDAEFKAFKMQK